MKNGELQNVCHLPRSDSLVMSTVCELENGHRHSDFSHETWSFAIMMLVYQGLTHIAINMNMGNAWLILLVVQNGDTDIESLATLIYQRVNGFIAPCTQGQFVQSHGLQSVVI